MLGFHAKPRIIPQSSHKNDGHCMSVELHFNQHRRNVSSGSSLFDYAETMGVRVPTSCRKQGKCKECVVEIMAGMECLSGRTPPEAHLKGNFRLSCSCRIVKEQGVVRCNTLQRGGMAIERHARQLVLQTTSWTPDPAVIRDGERILLDGVEIDRSNGPICGIAMDLGTTTVVLRLLNLETGQAVADASFENPQRFGGSDVMSRIQYDSEDGSKLLQRTVAGYVGHAIEEFPVRPESIYEMVVAGNSTMRDLFFRLDVSSIGQSPYRSITELEMGRARGQPPACATRQHAWDCPSIQRRVSMGCRSSAATWGLTRPRACWQWIWPTKSALSPSWISAPTRS